jgi:hypothetical protein
MRCLASALEPIAIAVGSLVLAGPSRYSVAWRNWCARLAAAMLLAGCGNDAHDGECGAVKLSVVSSSAAYVSIGDARVEVTAARRGPLRRAPIGLHCRFQLEGSAQCSAC